MSPRGPISASDVSPSRSRSSGRSSRTAVTATTAAPIDPEKGAQTDLKGTRSPQDNTDDGGGRRLRWAVAPWARADGWSGWMAESVKTEGLVVALVIQAFATGILDATTYADFSTFASNQTGNTILLTVSVIGTLPVLIELTAISLGAFLISSMIFGHLGHFFGVRRRAWLIGTTLLQIVQLIIAAVLVSPSGPRSTQIGGKNDWAVLLLFASMSGGQVAMARQSGSAELPTAPMTSSYVDLMADKYLFVSLRHPKAGPRNKRAVYILVMIAGGLLGAVMHLKAGSWVVVVVTAGLKLAAMVWMAVGEAEDPR